MTKEEKLLKLIELERQAGNKQGEMAALIALKDHRDAAAKVAGIETPATQSGDLVDQLMRGGGRFLRATAEGTAELADAFTGPIKAVGNLTGQTGYGSDTYSNAMTEFLDRLNVPSAQSGPERIVDEATKFGMSTIPFLGAGNMAAKSASPVTKGVGGVLSAHPMMQGVSASSAGAGAQTAEEKGFGPAAQFGAALVAGVTPAAVKGIAQSAWKRITDAVAGLHPQTKTILERYDAADLSPAAMERVAARVSDSLKTGELDTMALRRLIDYEMTDTTPTRGSLSLDPVVRTEEMNLAKAGANSYNPELQQLARTQGDNNRTLVEGLDEIADFTQLDPSEASFAMADPIRRELARREGEVNDLYSAARGTQGRANDLDREVFTSTAYRTLREQGYDDSWLPKKVRKKLAGIASGDERFDVDAANNLKTILATAVRSEADGNVRAALSAVRNALEETPMVAGASDEAMRAWDNARLARRELAAYQDSHPAIKALADGAEPDQFMKKYILSESASIKDIETLIGEVARDPSAMRALKYQVAAWIRDQGTGSGTRADGQLIANMSPAGLDKALTKLGDKKLKLFFSADEIEKMKATQRVAFYESYQPKGSAINNSNTASNVLGNIGILSPTIRAASAGIDMLSGPKRAREALRPNLSIQAEQMNASPAPRLSLLAMTPAEAIGGSLDRLLFGENRD